MKVPFVSLNHINIPLREAFLRRISKILQQSNFILGHEVAEFEKSFAASCGLKYSAGVANGMEAIEIALRALDIKRGDEVIVPAHTFIATWLAVCKTGATIVPVDADENTMNVNTSLIEQAVTPKTKAIVPVHLYGQPCRMDEIMEVAKKRNLFVIEDFAQSQGATFKSKQVGSFGNISATSFYPAKNIGATGDAGAVVTSEKNVFQRVLLIRNYGSAKKYIHELQGMNSRLDEVQAAFLNLKLPLLSKWNRQRRSIAKRYCKNLYGEKNIILPGCIPDAEHVYHLFVVRTEKRNELMEFLKRKGISTLIHYPIAPHKQKAFAGYFKPRTTFPVAEKLADTVLSLPIFVGITDSQIDYVCENVIKFFKQ